MAFAALPFVLAAAGSAATAIGGFSQAQYQAGVASNNAAIAAQNSLRAADQMQQQSQQIDNQYTATKGSQTAAYAGGNIDASTGTPMAVRAATNNNQAIDSQNIYSQGRAKITNFQQQAADYQADASADRTKGFMDLLQGGLSIGGAASKPGAFGASLVGGSSSLKVNSGIPINWNTSGQVGQA